MKIYKINDTAIKYLMLGGILTLIILPLFEITTLTFTKNSSYLNTLIEGGILTTYILNTLELIFKIGMISILLGFSSAYIVTMYKFPLKNLLKLILIMPLAIPVYVGGYTYSSIFYSNNFLNRLIVNDFFMGGSVFIYSIFLYPYIYIALRSYLKNNLLDYIEAAMTLGATRMSILKRIILPMVWPSIVTSTLFVIFETLSDFAVVEYYGVETLSKVITDSWLGLGQKDSAAKVSIILLIILVLLISFEKFLRRKKRYNGISNRAIKSITPNKFELALIYIIILPIITLGFGLPVFEMIRYSIVKFDYLNLPRIMEASGNTIVTIFISSLFIVGISAILACIVVGMKKGKKYIYPLGLIGYSVPSTVLGLGVYIFLFKIDDFIYEIFKIETFTIMNTRVVLLTALILKFLSVGFSNYSTTLDKIDKNIFMASYTLKNNFIGTLFKVKLPILKRPTKFVFIILFIDLIKELTLTYSLRPFNFNTLSTEVYRYAGNEMLEVASIPSLIIVFLCVVMILYLEFGGKNVRNKKS